MEEQGYYSIKNAGAPIPQTLDSSKRESVLARVPLSEVCVAEIRVLTHSYGILDNQSITNLIKYLELIRDLLYPADKEETSASSPLKSTVQPSQDEYSPTEAMILDVIAKYLRAGGSLSRQEE